MPPGLAIGQRVLIPLWNALSREPEMLASLVRGEVEALPRIVHGRIESPIVGCDHHALQPEFSCMTCSRVALFRRRQ